MHGPRVNLPNGTILQAHLRGNIPMSEKNLSETARRAHVFNGLNNASLISIGRLCDDNCIAVFDRKELNIYKNNKKVIHGTRNYRDGLWDIQLPTGNKTYETVSTNIQYNKLQNPEKENNKSHSPETYITVKDSTLGQIYNISEHQANMLVRRDTTKTELAEYYHKCMCSPTLTTLQQAVQKGHLHSWPGIQNLNFKKLINDILPTAKGHLDQERKNLRSTKTLTENVSTTKTELLEEDFHPANIEKNKTYEYASSIVEFQAKTTTYTDLTGRFPHVSSRGSEYIFVMYDYDSNAILAEPLKNRQAKTITDAWEKLHESLTKCGHKTKHFVLDNECSSDLKAALKKHNKTFELTPPNIHRRNAAERAIRTLKNHFLACLATCDPDFPVAEWDRLLPQTVLTLNLLRSSRANPNLSAYTYLFGIFDFNKTPLAPPGTKTLIHKKGKQRG